MKYFVLQKFAYFCKMLQIGVGGRARIKSRPSNSCSSCDFTYMDT